MSNRNPAREFLRQVAKQPFHRKWELAPGYYCGRGMPLFSDHDAAQFLAKSETERILVTHGAYTFALAWDTVRWPDGFRWGFGAGPEFYSIRLDGEEIARATTKRGLLVQWGVISGRPLAEPKPQEPMPSIAGTNPEGLTWGEWIAAASCFRKPHESQRILRQEWRNGVDPTEHAA